ncbi:hypothetical protein MANI_012262 [Metarhizium anisopliae]
MVLHSNPLRGDESTPSSISLGWNVIINRTATPDPADIDDIISYGAQIPGTRCPTCALKGKEVWVIPGRNCGYCGTPCDAH